MMNGSRDRRRCHAGRAPQTGPDPAYTADCAPLGKGDREAANCARCASESRKTSFRASGGDGGRAALSNYQGLVLRKLQRAKRILAARVQHGRGIVHLSFTILRDGSVTSAKVARSSGHAALDEAALALVRKAAPMPGVPGEITGVPLTFTVPVRFESN